MATIFRTPAIAVGGNVEDGHVLLQFLASMIAMFSSIASLILSYHTNYISLLRSVLWSLPFVYVVLGLHFFLLWCTYRFLCFLETRDREFLNFCIISVLPVVARLTPRSDFSSDTSIVLVFTSGLFCYLWYRMPSHVWAGIISVTISAFVLLFEWAVSFYPVVLVILWFKFKALTRPPSDDAGRPGGPPAPAAEVLEPVNGPGIDIRGAEGDNFARGPPAPAAEVLEPGIEIRGAERDISSSRVSRLTWLLFFANVAYTMWNMKKNVRNASTLKVDASPLTVSSFLESHGLGKYALHFQAGNVDMRALKQMGDRDLKELGVPMAPRKKILRAMSHVSAS